MKLLTLAAALMLGTMGLAFAQGTGGGAGGGPGTGSSQTGGTGAPGVVGNPTGNKPAPSSTLPDLSNSNQGIAPCSGAAPKAGCDPTGPGTGSR
jgi:hypothetical protein